MVLGTLCKPYIPSKLGKLNAPTHRAKSLHRGMAVGASREPQCALSHGQSPSPRSRAWYLAYPLPRARFDGRSERLWAGLMAQEREGNAAFDAAYVALGSRRYAEAVELYTQALTIAREIGAKRGEGIWLGNLGNAYTSLGDYLGDYAKAIDLHPKTLAIFREIGHKRGEGNVLWAASARPTTASGSASTTR